MQEPIFKTQSAHGDASLFEKLTFSWPLPFIETSQNGSLISFAQCGVLRKEDMLTDKYAQLKDHYQRLSGTKNALFMAICNTFKSEMIFVVLTELLMCANGCAQPIFLKMLIDYLKEGNTNGLTFQGLFLVLLYCLNELFERFGNSHKDIGKNLYGVKAKNLLRALVFEKCTSISNSTNKNFEEG